MTGDRWDTYRAAYEAKRDAAENLAFHVEWCDRHGQSFDTDRTREYIAAYRVAKAAAKAANPTTLTVEDQCR